MTTLSSPPAMRLPGMPPDLSTGYRRVLAAVVVGVHALVALWVVRAPAPAVVQRERAAIEVALISDQTMLRPRPEPVTPDPAPPPVQPTRTMPEPSRSPTPPVLASPQLAQPNDMVVPAAPVEPKPVVSTTPSPPSVAAPVTNNVHVPAVVQATEPARATAQPRVWSSSAVRYLVKPVLSYPRASRELGESGEVQLKVYVDEQGRPRDIEVLRSSGFPRLDQQAIQAMKAARFQPLMEDGAPRAVWVTPGPLIFNLEEQ